MSETIERRPRVAKGPAADLLDCKDAERLLALVMASAAEISALYDRIDTLERFVLDKLDGSCEDLAAVSAEASAAREEWRRGYVGRLLRGFEAELDEGGRIMSRADYEAFMDDLNRADEG